MKRFRIAKSEVTDEALFLRRRELLRLGAGAALGLGLGGCPTPDRATAAGGGASDEGGDDDGEGRPPRLEGVRDAPPVTV